MTIYRILAVLLYAAAYITLAIIGIIAENKSQK